MKLSPAAHKNIFLAACLCLAVALIAAAALADGDRVMHKSLYEKYQAADEMFKNQQFEEPYEIYRMLAGIYKGAYILELKMAVCAMNLDMWPEAVEHSRRALELYPRLAKDEEFMDSLSYNLEQIGELEKATQIHDYYYDFAMGQ